MSWILPCSGKLDLRTGPVKGTVTCTRGRTVISSGVMAASFSLLMVRSDPDPSNEKTGLFTMVHLLCIKCMNKEPSDTLKSLKFAFQRMVALARDQGTQAGLCLSLQPLT